MNRHVARDCVPGFARIVAARRRDLGLTQAQVAAKAGVAEATCQNAESYGAVTLGNAVRIITALGLSVAITPDGCRDVTRQRSPRPPRASHRSAA